MLVKKSVQNSIDTLTKQARENGKNFKFTPSPTTSSLHKVIRTREQADRFMRLLEVQERHSK